jgi:phytoene desaturase
MLPVFLQVHALSKHYGRMRGYFDEPRLKAAFTFQDVYMGLSPYEAPSTFSMMSYTELAHGVYYPRGGMYTMIKALLALAQQAGVQFEFNTTVDQILLEGNRTTGVRLANGSTRLSDVVLANADLPYVYERLLPPTAYSRSLLDKRYSCSTLSFFWGVDKRYDTLPAHTLFLADEYRQNFDTIRRTQDVPHDACLYIHAPSRLDASMAPAGQDTLIAILPIGHLQPQAQDWRLVRDQARQEVFRRLELLGIRDLGEHIKFETTYNPLSWRRRYNLVKGATHGLSHNLLQLGYFRPSNRHPDIHNLYFVGASTHPGTGLPTAMVSSRHASQRIADENDN